MTIIERTSAHEMAELRTQYMAALTAPLDGMWEAFTHLAVHWEIRDGAQRIGYFCVNAEGRLLQFHVAPRCEDRAQQAFADAIRDSRAGGAMVSSFEPWLPHCLDLHRELRVHSLLYHDHQPCETPIDGEGLSPGVVPESDRETVEALMRTWFADEPGEWLTGYLQTRVARGELLALRDAERLLGTGELRVSDSQAPYADLGVIVSPEQRGRGLAPRVLSRLKRRCARAGLVPICSTTLDNRSAQRAITKAGFVNRHRLLEVLF